MKQHSRVWILSCVGSHPCKLDIMSTMISLHGLVSYAAQLCSGNRFTDSSRKALPRVTALQVDVLHSTDHTAQLYIYTESVNMAGPIPALRTRPLSHARP